MSPAPLRIDGVEGLLSAIGRSIGPSPEFAVSDETVAAYESLVSSTEDLGTAHHGAEGGAIAPGMLSAGLVPMLLRQIAKFSGFGRSTQYGVDGLRLLKPVTAGSALSLSGKLASAEPNRDRYLATFDLELRRDDTLVLVGRYLYLFWPP